METLRQLDEGKHFVVQLNASSEVMEAMKSMGFKFEDNRTFFGVHGVAQCEYHVALIPEKWSVKLEGYLFYALNEEGKARVCTDTAHDGRTCLMHC